MIIHILSFNNVLIFKKELFLRYLKCEFKEKRDYKFFDLRPLLLNMPRYEEDNVPNYAQNILLIVLSFIIPPVPIIMLSDNSIFTKECLISVILTLLGHIPGVLFSLYYILIEYPKRATRHSGRDGYIRIEDEDEIRPIHATDSNQFAQDQQETQGSLLNVTTRQ